MRKIILSIIVILTWYLPLFAQEDFWERTKSPIDDQIEALEIKPNGDIFGGTNYGIYRSTDNGDSWIQINNGINVDDHISSFVFSPLGYVFVGTESAGVYHSSDNGNNWIKKETILHHVYCLATNAKGHIFAGVFGDIYRSTDNGNNWINITINVNHFEFCIIFSLLINSNGDIFAGTSDGGIFLSNDNGANWNQVYQAQSPIDRFIEELATNSKDEIFFGTWSGVYYSTDNGKLWFNTGIETVDVSSIAINSKDHIFAASRSGVMMSTDKGDNWSEINTGLTNQQVYSITLNSKDVLFASTIDGVFRSKQPTTSVKENNYSKMSLTQNFPNPFSTNTEIKFNIQNPDFVTLKIFDELGREIKTLVDDFLDVGDHTAKFDGTGLSTGIYFYSLRTSKGVETKKMVYIAE